MLKSVYTTIIKNIHSGRILDCTISISMYNPLGEICYLKFPKELDHLRKGLINIQNIDNNNCLKWRLVGYVNPADHYPARITETDKGIAKRLDFKDIKFPIKIEIFTKLNKKKNSIYVSVFGYKNKEKVPINVSKKCKEKHVDLSCFIKDISTVMYDHTLHHQRKHFCCYCLQAFETAEKLKCYIKDCFKINGKQTIKIPKKVSMLNCKF